MNSNPTQTSPPQATSSILASSAEIQIAEVTAIKERLRERFHLYEEIKALPPSDRDAMFQILWAAQQGDTSALDSIRDLIYDEVPVGMEEFLFGRRYLNLRNKITPEKVELLLRADAPNVRRIYCAAGTGSGKALPLDTRLPTPDGWTTMGSVQPGDQLIDERGLPCRVVAKSPVEYRDVHQVTFDDGASLVAADTHEWVALTTAAGKRLRRPGRPAPRDWREHWSHGVVVETKGLSGRARARRPFWVPCSLPLPGAAMDFTIPPYTLGVWLGDGVSAYAAVVVGHSDSTETLGHVRNDGYVTRERVSQRKPGASTYGVLGLHTQLRHAGLLNNKHIPSAYLRGSALQRLALLQGLMDTDGFNVRGVGEVGIELTHKPLADGVAELIRTFGWKLRCSTKPAKLYGRVVGTVYRMRFRPDVPVFRLSRKVRGWVKDAGQPSRHTARWVASVEPIGRAAVQCVQVDSPSHLYLAGDDFIPTHNSFMVSCGMSRQVYNLLCLRRPDLFYFLGPGSRISIVNLSVSKEQARDVIFAEFIARISQSPWFGQWPSERLAAKARFPKHIYVFSGGSSATAYYGYHTIFGSLDEASFLADRNGASVAGDLVEAMTKSLNSRFPRAFKLWVISTLRANDDYLYLEIERVKEDNIRLV